MDPKLKKHILTVIKFACVAIPLWICAAIIWEIKTVIDANPLLKVPVIAGTIGVVLIVLRQIAINSGFYKIKVIDEGKE